MDEQGDSRSSCAPSIQERSMPMKDWNVEMKRFITLLSFVVAISCTSAAPFSFDEAASNVQEFVVVKITNAVTNATIALVLDQLYSPENSHEPLIPLCVRSELGLREKLCVETLKGDVSIGGFKKCYFYKSNRDEGRSLFGVYDSILCGPVRLRYYDRGKWVTLTGRDAELFIDPPYDPYSSHEDDFVKLMLLTPEKQLDVSRIKPTTWFDGTSTIKDAVGKDYTNCTPVQIAHALKIESAFSNRVFRLNEACSFQVDYPVPDNDEWPRYLFKSKAEYIAWTNRIHAENTSLMHLSPDEVSEITYLAYFADNVDTNGYNAACARCPLILRPVIEFKTTIGKRLRQAMSEGGMITTNNLPNVAAAP